jgi:hypothetical protein
MTLRLPLSFAALLAMCLLCVSLPAAAQESGGSEAAGGADAAEAYYQQQRSQIADDDEQARYDLAFVLYDRQAYAIALRELNAMRQQFPDSTRVRTLQLVVENRLRQQQEQQREQNPPQTPQQPGTGEPMPGNPDTAEDPSINTGGPSTPPGPEAVAYETQPAEGARPLDNEQVNLIKVYEVDLDDEPRVQVAPAAAAQLIRDYAGQGVIPDRPDAERQFRRLEGHQQLAVIFEVRARELYPQVRILDEPEPLQFWRTTISPQYIARYFRPTFGDGDLPLFLFTGRPTDENLAYTNLYILERYRHDGLPMIDRDRPERSLLVQWGLPREDAAYPAPDIEGWRPFFRGEDDPRYQQYLQWIDALYGNQTPDYGIDYALPVHGGGGQ